MKYLSAAKAAQQLDVSEKTVRRWITTGRIKTQRIADRHGETQKFAIPESEVERLKRAEYKEEASTDIPTANTDVSTTDTDMSVLLGRIGVLEEERAKTGEYLATVPDLLDALQARLTEQDAKIAHLQSSFSSFVASIDAQLQHLRKIIDMPSVAADQEQQPAQITTTAPTEPKKSAGRPVGVKAKIEPPVEGAILAKDFAERYGINPRTFRDHIIKALGEKAFSRPKPGREAIEREYWILPGQEQIILDYWRKHGVSTYLPDDWVPLNTFAKEHSLNRNELEQLGNQGHIKGVERGSWRTREGEKVHLALSPQGQQNALAYFRTR